MRSDWFQLLEIQIHGGRQCEMKHGDHKRGEKNDNSSVVAFVGSCRAASKSTTLLPISSDAAFSCCGGGSGEIGNKRQEEIEEKDDN